MQMAEFERINKNINILSNLMQKYVDPPSWVSEQYELYCTELESLHSYHTKNLLQKSRIKYNMEGEQRT